MARLGHLCLKLANFVLFPSCLSAANASGFILGLVDSLPFPKAPPGTLWLLSLEGSSSPLPPHRDRNVLKICFNHWVPGRYILQTLKKLLG